MDNFKKIIRKFIGDFSEEDFAEKVSNLSDSEQDELSEYLIQDSIESGGGVALHQESDSSDFVDMFVIFKKRMEGAHSEITLNEEQFIFCITIANRMKISGMDPNDAVDMAILFKDESHVDVENLVDVLRLMMKNMSTRKKDRQVVEMVESIGEFVIAEPKHFPLFKSRGGITIRHPSDSVDMLGIFSKRVDDAHGDVCLSKRQRKFCFKIANRLELLGVDANKAVDIAINHKSKVGMDVNKLVKQQINRETK